MESTVPGTLMSFMCVHQLMEGEYRTPFIELKSDNNKHEWEKRIAVNVHVMFICFGH